jgi:hypothetical protein
MKYYGLVKTGRNSFPVLLASFFFSMVVYGQPEYQAGMSSVSIEPDNSLISLHLGGYGAPREGRFTLQWKKEDCLSEVSALCGTSDRLFVISEGEILFKSLSGSEPKWEKACKAGKIQALAIIHDKIFGVDGDGKFFVARLQERIRWKKSELPEKQAVSLTSSGTDLFALDREGMVWHTNLSDRVVSWTKLESVDGIISLAAGTERLFALTVNGIILQCKPAGKEIKWMKAAYRNNFTISEDIKMITISGNRLYGISKDGILYSGEHRSEGNLTVRAMAIKRDEKTIVILNVDVCGLNDKYTALLKKEILKKHNLPASAVFINSSHTHFAPVSQEWFTWQEANQRPDSTYLYSTIKTGILSAVDNALVAMSPAYLFFGRGSTDIGYNRSLKDNPQLVDGSVDVIKVKFAGSNDEACLFLASCHPVFSTAGKLHYTISANYPGVARKLVEERSGVVNSLFLQGTAGDINPRDNGEYITGEKLANEVIAVLNRPMTEIKGEISFSLDTINIPVTPWTKDEITEFRKQNINKPGDINAEKNVKWCDLMMKYYIEGKMPVALPVYFHTINIGSWKLVGFSRETTTGYGLGVKNLWPDKHITVAGYTNDVSSYLPTYMHIEAKTYEGLDSFFWYGMPAVFPATVDTIILNKIKTLER